jgi:hypothetical protein
MAARRIEFTPPPRLQEAINRLLKTGILAILLYSAYNPLITIFQTLASSLWYGCGLTFFSQISDNQQGRLKLSPAANLMSF